MWKQGGGSGGSGSNQDLTSTTHLTSNQQFANAMEAMEVKNKKHRERAHAREEAYRTLISGQKSHKVAIEFLLE